MTLEQKNQIIYQKIAKIQANNLIIALEQAGIEKLSNLVVLGRYLDSIQVCISFNSNVRVNIITSENIEKLKLYRKRVVNRIKKIKPDFKFTDEIEEDLLNENTPKENKEVSEEEIGFYDFFEMN